MRKSTIVIIVLILAAFGGLVAWALLKKSENSANYAEFNANAIIGPNKYNGEIGDHVFGNAAAPVLIFEYADYQCPGCASTYPRLKTILDEYGNQLGIVYRSYLLSYHQNGTAAAAAAEAAGLQGYWAEYANLLFTNQSEWEYASVKERGELFAGYFSQASNGAGDLEKFQSDMSSPNVKKKIDFDMGLGKYVDVQSTPWLVIDGEHIDITGSGTEDSFLKLMRGKIDAALEKRGVSPKVEIREEIVSGGESVTIDIAE
ncbi:thioredoxin domain-containing protein [Candidatus Saccharibacteria bacterium]|nr:thioredoxin domain-containing protein [Candidatus Saccharibacteria bacterium]